MPNYSYFYVRAVVGDDGSVKTQKFLKGDPKLLDTKEDVWTTRGRYKLNTRHLRGGLSGTGDIYDPSSALFRSVFFPEHMCSRRVKELALVYFCSGRASFLKTPNAFTEGLSKVS